jgi:phage FluMu protein Com
MPIRFRCAYCNQLLGISRRKAGMVVRCPTCAGQVAVPNADAEVTEGTPGPSNPLVFERSDFDALLNTEGAVPMEKKESVATAADAPGALPTASNPPSGAWGTHAEPAYAVERINPVPSVAAGESVPKTGIFLSSRNATLLAGAVAVLLALFFAAGLLVGLWLRPAGQESEHGQSRAPAVAATKSWLLDGSVGGSVNPFLEYRYRGCGSNALAQAVSSAESGGSGAPV